MKKAFLFLFAYMMVFMISVIFNCAYAKPIDNTAKIWNNFTYLGTLSSDKKWLYDLEYEMDFKAKTNVYDSSTLTAMLGYKPCKKFSFWIGTDYIPTLNDSDNSTDIEQRFYPQVVWRVASTNKVNIVSRSRLELRIDNQASGSTLLIRQKIAISGRKKNFHFFTPLISDELFINLNKPNYTSNQLINENRFFLGGNINLKPNVNLIVGYLNQSKFKASEIFMNHALEFVLIVNA